MERKNLFSGLQRGQSRKHSSVSNSAVKSVERGGSAYQMFKWVQAWIRVYKEEEVRKDCEQCKYFGGYYKDKATCDLVDREVHCCVLKKEGEK